MTMVRLPPSKATIFGVPSLELAATIDDNDKVAKAQAAHFRMAARLRELESTYEVKASEIRSAFLAEMIEAIGE